MGRQIPAGAYGRCTTARKVVLSFRVGIANRAGVHNKAMADDAKVVHPSSAVALAVVKGQQIEDRTLPGQPARRL
jgi:hypothetical protein